MPDFNVTSRKIAAIIVAVVVLWFLLPERSVRQPTGILVPSEPKQGDVRATAPFAYKNYQISLLRTYELKARILAKNIYWPLTASARDLSPLDMVFGWGIMSDNSVLDHMSFNITNRYYRAHYDADSPYVWEQMEPYLDNNHLIPATDKIEHALKSARVGSVIHLKGFLVQASRPDGYNWVSSTSIGSVGDTVMTCKLIYVTDFDIVQ